jgi:4-amino-4-deoxy-L-arabinose transferase-like glycosyltransferase
VEILAEPRFGNCAAAPPRRRASEVGGEKILVALTLAALLGVGIFLRIFPSSGFQGVGFDEHAYAVFVQQIQKVGLENYDAVVQVYLERQATLPEAVVPATRVGFLALAAVAADAFHLEPLRALRLISCLTSIGLLLATTLIAFRHGGIGRMLIVTALMAIAPLQLALAQRALIDGYFAFWAVLTAWFFWEAWTAPRKRSWLLAYGASLFVLILTKENAAFVFLALVATGATLCLLDRRRPDAQIVLVSLASCALALFVLVSLAGGLPEWIAFYRMFAAKSRALPYAMHMQDGAWYRYLVDFTMLSPVIVALVIGRIFQLERTAKFDFFWALFLGFSFVAMTSVPGGMSLRFAAYWDEPLRWLAASQLLALAPRFSRKHAAVVLALATIFCLTIDLSQYSRLFVTGGIYDPVSAQLFHASGLVR